MKIEQKLNEHTATTSSHLIVGHYPEMEFYQEDLIERRKTISHKLVPALNLNRLGSFNWVSLQTNRSLNIKQLHKMKIRIKQIDSSLS